MIRKSRRGREADVEPTRCPSSTSSTIVVLVGVLVLVILVGILHTSGTSRCTAY